MTENNQEVSEELSGQIQEDQPWIWCLIANVTRNPHVEGDSPDLRLGVKHFAPGAKLYVFPSLWGDGGKRVKVLGHHRGDPRRFTEIIVNTKHLENWRCRRVYHIHIIRAMSYPWACNDTKECQVQIQQMADTMNQVR